MSHLHAKLGSAQGTATELPVSVAAEDGGAAFDCHPPDVAWAVATACSSASAQIGAVSSDSDLNSIESAVVSICTQGWSSLAINVLRSEQHRARRRMPWLALLKPRQHGIVPRSSSSMLRTEAHRSVARRRDAVVEAALWAREATVGEGSTLPFPVEEVACLQ